MSEESNSLSINIPEELILEILKRLPVKSLIRFISVCKSWYSMIKNPNFISTHFNHQIAILNKNQGPRYLVYYAFSETETSKFFMLSDNDNLDMHQELNLSEKLGNVGFCNGIVCFMVSFNFVLWNISLRKTFNLGSPKFVYEFGKYENYGFGFDALSNDYKLVSFNYFYHASNETRLCDIQVYSLNVGYWRVINSSISLPYDCSIHLHNVHLNGVIHWMVDRSVESYVSNPYSILAFNVAEESFSVMSSPGDIEYDPDEGHNTQLITVPRDDKECLGYLHDDNLVIDLWVMEEYGVPKSWKLMLSISTNRVFGFFGYRNLVNVRMNGEIVMEQENGSVVLLDPQSMRTRVISDKRMYYEGIYVESLVLL